MKLMNNDNCGKSYNASADSCVLETTQTYTAMNAEQSSLSQNPPVDPTAIQSLRLAEESGALDFWHHPEEDIYSQDDGEAI